MMNATNLEMASASCENAGYALARDCKDFGSDRAADEALIVRAFQDGAISGPVADKYLRQLDQTRWQSAVERVKNAPVVLKLGAPVVVIFGVTAPNIAREASEGNYPAAASHVAFGTAAVIASACAIARNKEK